MGKNQPKRGYGSVTPTAKKPEVLPSSSGVITEKTPPAITCMVCTPIPRIASPVRCPVCNGLGQVPLEAPSDDRPIVPGVKCPANCINGYKSRLAPITVEWHRSRVYMMRPSNMSIAPMVDLPYDGMHVGPARNKAVHTCIDRTPPVPFLLFIDWDVLLPPDGLRRLMYHAQNNPDFDVFTGLYVVKGSPSEPMLYKELGGGAHWDFTLGDVLTDMAATGMGCALLRTSLFERLGMEEPWFLTDVGSPQLDGQGNVRVDEYTEDLYFFEQYKKKGGKLLVDTSLLCGHISNETGQVSGLPSDSLPVRRAMERLGVKTPLDMMKAMMATPHCKGA